MVFIYKLILHLLFTCHGTIAFMNVPTYLVAQNVHGPRSTPPQIKFYLQMLIFLFERFCRACEPVVAGEELKDVPNHGSYQGNTRPVKASFKAAIRCFLVIFNYYY